jgi:hypothetical protein
MPQTVTLNLPEHVVSRAQVVARRTSRPLETILLEWLERAGQEDLESLSDEQLLTLCDSMMNADSHDELSDLLARNRENELDESGRRRLAELMAEYQQGLLRKARAWKTAVARGLKSRLE